MAITANFLKTNSAVQAMLSTAQNKIADLKKVDQAVDLIVRGDKQGLQILKDMGLITDSNQIGDSYWLVEKTDNSTTNYVVFKFNGKDYKIPFGTAAGARPVQGKPGEYELYYIARNNPNKPYIPQNR